MSYTVRVEPGAVGDLDAALDYYAAIGSHLALALGDEFYATAHALKLFPNSHRAVYRQVRRVGLPSFPYLVYYAVGAGVVRVLAVLPERQDPAKTQRVLGRRAA
ncbi:MAG: type II toxin-antitoxin system RelE/ParE family toxin [Bifidobacteriaceae bacterium]|nr:type II toxin-antitoxin system RelE/ParE family toxin [Bifidobacteriaceae bacterium]